GAPADLEAVVERVVGPDGEPSEARRRDGGADVGRGIVGDLRGVVEGAARADAPREDVGDARARPRREEEECVLAAGDVELDRLEERVFQEGERLHVAARSRAVAAPGATAVAAAVAAADAAEGRRRLDAPRRDRLRGIVLAGGEREHG